jgi:hypothetical protein
MIHRFAAVPIGVGLLVTSAFGADEKKPPKPPAAKAAAPRPAPQAKGKQRPQEDPRRQLDRIMNMKPEQRQKWLESLPPQRRQNIERRLGEYQKIPTPERKLLGTQLEMLQSLPPQRQAQVKRSMRQFEAIPEERRQQMTQELRRMSTMSDEDRRAYMNTEEFRNRYSPTEQQIMGNISEITPEMPPHD